MGMTVPTGVWEQNITPYAFPGTTAVSQKFNGDPLFCGTSLLYKHQLARQ